MDNSDQRSQKIPIAISSCLLGENVRYNGAHKRSDFCVTTLAPFFDFLSLCPEVGIGLGVPREPIRLVGDWTEPRAVGTTTKSLDVTVPLIAYADEVAPQVQRCRGYILMNDSPSCGLYSTKVYSAEKPHSRKRGGIYADRLRLILPLMPMAEIAAFDDPAIRENFIARVYVFDDWLVNVAPHPKAKALVEFHSRHKYWTMAYSQTLYRSLGRTVASAGQDPILQLCDRYIGQLMDGTREPPGRKGHVNVLFHLAGYIRKTAPENVRKNLADAIDEYRRELVPLAVPIELMQRYFDEYASNYVCRQSYLNPYPRELGLRNALF